MTLLIIEKTKQAEVIKNQSVEPKSYISDILIENADLEKRENYFYVNNGDLNI